MALIDEIVVQQPTLHPKVANLLIKMFEQTLPVDFEIKLQLDVRKCILDRMVHLIGRGFYTLPLLIFMQKKVKHLDASLIRYFITKLLSSVSSPYSKRFQSIILNLINTAEVQYNEIDVVKKFIYYTKTGQDPVDETAEIDVNNIEIKPQIDTLFEVRDGKKSRKSKSKRKINKQMLRQSARQKQKLQLESTFEEDLQQLRSSRVLRSNTPNKMNRIIESREKMDSPSENLRATRSRTSVSNTSDSPKKPARTTRQNSQKNKPQPNYNPDSDDYSVSSSEDDNAAFLM